MLKTGDMTADFFGLDEAVIDCQGVDLPRRHCKKSRLGASPDRLGVQLDPEVRTYGPGYLNPDGGIDTDGTWSIFVMEIARV